MSNPLGNQLKEELAPGETIIWYGKPDPGIFFEKEDLVTFIPNMILAFVVLFVLCKLFLREFSILGVFLVVLITSIFMIPFIAMIIGKFITGPLRRRKTLYIITNFRIIIQSEYKTLNMKSVNLDAIKTFNLSIQQNGKGTLRLGDEINTPWNSRHTTFKYYLVDRSVYIPEFEMIDDPKSVFELIKNLQKQQNQQSINLMS